MLSQGMRHGCCMKPLNQSSSSWSGGTLHRQQRQNSSRPLQLGRSCAQCFGAEKASYLKAPQSIAGFYCNTQKLRRWIQNERLGMLSRAVVMIRDNTCLHCNANSLHDIWLGTIRSRPLPPPCNPELAPSDFHVFLHLKSFLAGRRFRGVIEVKEAITTCFA